MPAPKIALSFGAQSPEAKREPYRAALRSAGIDFVENPATLAGLDGLVLTGGPDVDPALYHQTREPETEEIDGERDQRELSLTREALERDVPILAICRGLQLFNVCLGGTLTQHIERHRLAGQPDAHPVEIRAGTRLASILQAGEYQVNSRHHQCAAKPGKNAVVAATAPDGVIEALEVAGKRFAVAVQWHPEDRTAGLDRKLFEAFAEALETVTLKAPA